MASPESSRPQTIVLKLIFAGRDNFIEISRDEGSARYRSKKTGTVEGDFLGLKVYTPKPDHSGREKNLVLECPGEDAYWKKNGDIIASHRNLLPPEDAEPISTLELGTGAEEFNIWIRIPNFLLPIYHSLDGERDVRRDGNYSWLALNLRHRFGEAVWTLGVAAGGDTKDWLWFKDAKWGSTVRLSDGNVVGGLFGQRRQIRGNELKYDFKSVARHISIPAPFPSPSPRTFLRSACERILGLDPIIHEAPQLAANPASGLHIIWEAESGSDSVLRPVLRRVFRRTATAPEPMFVRPPGAGVSTKSGNSDEEPPFVLMQKPRLIDELEDARLRGRRWYLQVSVASPAVCEVFSPEEKDLESRHERLLEAMFTQSWEGLMKSLRPDAENNATALFGLAVKFKNLTDDRVNPLPELDLAFQSDTDGHPYLSRNQAGPREGIGQFRVESRPPKLSALPLTQVAAAPRFRGFSGTLSWFALRNHRGGPLRTSGAISAGEPRPNDDLLGDSSVIFRNDSPAINFNEWHLGCNIVVIGTEAQQNQDLPPIRAGSLDIFPGTIPDTPSQDLGCPCQFSFRHVGGFSNVWETVASLELALFAFGWAEDADNVEQKLGAEDSDRQARFGSKAWAPIPDVGLRIPIADIKPGEADHYEAETQSLIAPGGSVVSADRPLIFPIKPTGALEKTPWVLELSEIDGRTFTHQLTARIKLLKPLNEASTNRDTRRLSVLYIDRTPFFVAFLELYGITQFAPEDGNEAAYFSTNGIFRGWQLRSAQNDYLLHLPPQGVGEAMEKGKLNEGYDDIDEGQTVDFRFPPISTLTIKTSDFERRYGPAPWNLRLTLNELKDNNMVGLPLKAAEFEMLYGLRMKIDNAPFLRVAEVLARLGLPRDQVLRTPLNREYLPSDALGLQTGNGLRSGTKGKVNESSPFTPAEQVYQDIRHSWKRLLQAINSRLAVYEVFDDRQVEFGKGSEPAGLVLEGNAQHPVVSAELRKAAQLRVSMAAEWAVIDGQVKDKDGKDLPFYKPSSLPLSNEEPLRSFPKSAARIPLDTAVEREWWSKLIPNYDDGLAGSFAWAFESRLLYESLWASNPNPDTPGVVEAVEATVARLYFSALGGWSSQRAAFANGKIVIVVTVEMGRVSELRVEVIGRIGVFWNKAKLVTVFRRSVLPSDQFQDQQDLHEGRPLLRKAEEYIEFLEKNRPANDALTLRSAGGADLDLKQAEQKSGCLKACFCEEKILVDSRWGTDVYDKTGSGVGVKIPLRKPGAPAHIYKPANLLLQFHAHQSGPTNEVAGRIENLEDVVFWTDVRLDKTADTDSWPAIVDVDIFSASASDKANPGDAENFWKDSTRLKDWQDAIAWGTPPVDPSSAHCTFRVAGITKEVSLNKHLLGNAPADLQQPVGAILRNVTVSRGVSTLLPPENDILKKVSMQLQNSTAGLRAASEHATALLEQLTTRVQETGERVFGWEENARNALSELGVTDKIKVDRLLEDFHPMTAIHALLEERLHEVSIRAELEVGHFLTGSTELGNTLRTKLSTLPDSSGPQAIFEAIEEFRKEAFAGLETGKKLLDEIVAEATAAANAYANLKAKSTILLKDFLEVLPKEFKNFEDQLNRIKQDVRRSVTGGTSGESLEALEAHFQEQLRGYLIRLFTEKLRDVATKYLDPKQREKTKSDLKVLVSMCLEQADDFFTELVSLWDTVATTAKDETAYLRVSAHAVATCFTVGFKATVLKEKLLLAATVSEAAAAIKEKDAKLQNLLQKAGGLHRLLESLLRRQVPDWALQSADEGGKLDREAFTKRLADAIEQHCREQIAALDSVIAQVGEQAVKRLGMLEQLERALTNAAVEKIDDIKKLFRIGDTPVKEWTKAALIAKQSAWTEMTKVLQTVGNSPVIQMTASLIELKNTFTGDNPRELEKRLNTEYSITLQKNVLHLVERADRELRSVTDQMRTGLGQIAAEGEDLTKSAQAQIGQFVDDWFDSGKKLQRALENISGTTAHALKLIERGKEMLTKLEKLPPLAELTLADATEQAKNLVRQRFQPFRQLADELAQQLQLPWLRTLPKQIDPDRIAESLRRINDELELVSRNALKSVTDDALARYNRVVGQELQAIHGLITELKTNLSTLQNTLQRLSGTAEAFTRETIDTARLKLKVLSDEADRKVTELREKITEMEDNFRKDLETYATRLNTALSGNLANLLNLKPEALLNAALSRLGLNANDLENAGKEAIEKQIKRLPSLLHLERGLPELQSWVDRQRESANLLVDYVRGTLDVVQPVREAQQALVETFRAFGQVPTVPGLNFKDMADLNRLANFPDQAKGYINNLNARVRQVSYAFDRAAKSVAERLRMTPVKAMVDRLKTAEGEVVEEARMRAATVESAVRNIGEKVEADARRMIDNVKPSLKDLLPDFGGLKLEKLLSAAGLSDGLIQQFQDKLKTQHGFDPQSMSAFVDCRLDDLVLDSALTVFSFGPVALRLRNVRMSSHLRIEAGKGKETKRQGDGKLTADWDILVGGNAVITYEQAALENVDGNTRMQLDPKKVRMPSILQSVADTMSGLSAKDDSGLQAGIISRLPNEITGYVKFNMDVASAGAPTSGIQNLRISLFFELGLRFPRFPSLQDADLRVSAGVGLSDREAPFIFAIWILGGCGWFSLRLDYLVPFKDGSPRLDIRLDVGLGVSASLAFDCGFASGSVYVALAVRVTCLISKAKGQSSTTFSMVLTMAGNLNILGIITVQLLIVLSIGYSSPGPMIGSGMIRVKIKICWCFTLKVERSFTKRFSGSGGQSLNSSRETSRLAGATVPPLSIPAVRLEPAITRRRISQAHQVHRKAARMSV